MKKRLSVVTEYSKGKSFEEAVAKLFKNGLMNGSYKIAEVENREQARKLCKSWFCINMHEAEVKYIVVEKYDEEYDEWFVDYSEGIEVLSWV